MNCLKLLLASLLLTAQLGKGGYASSDPTSYGSEPGVLEVEEPSDAIKVKLLQAWRERAEEKKDRTRDSATLKENLLDIAFEAARSTSETDNDLMPLCLVEAALRDPVYRYIDFASTDRVHEADIRGRVPADFGKMGHFLRGLGGFEQVEKLVKDGIRFRVVFSVDGGGIRGMIPALYFHWLETSLGQNMCNVGDLFAGTSVGGIIACGLNRPSAPMRGL